MCTIHPLPINTNVFEVKFVLSPNTVGRVGESGGEGVADVQKVNISHNEHEHIMQDFEGVGFERGLGFNLLLPYIAVKAQMFVFWRPCGGIFRDGCRSGNSIV
jgi:hypothetical protein